MIVITLLWTLLNTVSHARRCSVPHPAADASELPLPHSGAMALAGINTQHAAENLPPIRLPTTFFQAPPDQKVIMLINAERLSRRLPRLNNAQDENDPLLAYITTNHSRVVAAHPKFWSMPPNTDGVAVPHENAIDGGFAGRIYSVLGKKGITTMGEIIAVDENPEGAVYGWMYVDADSDWGHRENILDCEFQYAGAGIAADPATDAVFGHGSFVFSVDFIYSADHSYHMVGR
jgi:hypothetical protein